MRNHLGWAVFLLAAIACLATFQARKPESEVPERATASPRVTPRPMSLPAVGAMPEIDLRPEDGLARARTLPGHQEVGSLRNPLRGRAVTSASIQLFEARCAGCHGPAGCGDFPRGFSTPPDLPDLHKLESFKLGAGDLGIFRTIKFGIPHTNMFPARGKLNDRQIWELVNLVRALQRASR